jgi:hypothetical protein
LHLPQSIASRPDAACGLRFALSEIGSAAARKRVFVRGDATSMARCLFAVGGSGGQFDFGVVDLPARVHTKIDGKG